MKFRFKFSPLIYGLLALVVALSIAGLAWNIYNLFAVQNQGALQTVSYVVIGVISLAVLAISLGVLLFGYYVIKGTKLYVYFGFIRTFVDLNDVIAITHFKLSDKLVIYYKDEKFSVITISPKKYDDFISAVLKINGNVIFSSKEKEERE